MSYDKKTGYFQFDENNYSTLLAQPLGGQLYVLGKNLNEDNKYISFDVHGDPRIEKGSYCECLRDWLNKIKEDAALANNDNFMDNFEYFKNKENFALKINGQETLFFIVNQVSINGETIAFGRSYSEQYPNDYKGKALTTGTENEGYWCCTNLSYFGPLILPEEPIIDTLENVIKEFSSRVEKEIPELEEKISQYHEMLDPSDIRVLISPEDDLNHRIVLINKEYLSEQNKFAEYQLGYVTSGFGANEGGTGKIYVRHFDKNKTDSFFYRRELDGMVPAENLPDWARQQLDQVIQNIRTETNRDGR